MLDPMLLVGNAMQMRVAEGELGFFLFLIPLQKQWMDYQNNYCIYRV
jgi:hypothetical protein